MFAQSLVHIEVSKFGNIYTFAISSSDSFIPQILKVEGSLGKKVIFSDPWDSGFLPQGGGGGRGGALIANFALLNFIKTIERTIETIDCCLKTMIYCLLPSLNFF